MFNKKRLNRQKGQSLIYVSILIVILISGVFFVYDIGSTVNTKIQFQNGADAAALAAVAVKISKHHTETLVRASMYHESVAAQANLRVAQAALVQLLLSGKKEILDFKPDPNIKPPPQAMPQKEQKDIAQRYIDYSNKTYRHVVKVHRERLALEGYYAWLTGKPAGLDSGIGQIATVEAARIGFRANTPSAIFVGDNLKILLRTDDLIENNPKFGNIAGGAIPYSGEGATKKGNFGKTFVEFDGEGARLIHGSTFLKYAPKYIMTTNASAKIASSDDLGLPVTVLRGLPLIGDLRMLWYYPRLMSIESREDKITLH